MSRMMSFKADDAEESEISEYCKAKHFKSIPDFLRYAVFGYMDRNRLGAHHPVTGKRPGRPLKSLAGAKHEETGGNPVPRLYDAS